MVGKAEWLSNSPSGPEGLGTEKMLAFEALLGTPVGADHMQASSV
jgi:hypothetical protein